MNENAVHISNLKLTPAQLADIIGLIDSGKVNFAVAASKIFPVMINNASKTALQIAEENNLVQESDEGALLEIVKEAVAKFPAKVAEYKSGKTGLVGLFMGEVMKLSKGKADPKVASELVTKVLNEHP
jgi:aspartyl-tRNA(Asn)/glutamyl-tRNA(Gln) amidotransferase subunit B